MLNGKASQSARHYPMLEPCRVIMTSETTRGGLRPSVRLPPECFTAARSELPTLYDFALEKEILQCKDDRLYELSLADSRDGIQQTILSRMQSVTKAGEEVCVTLLEDNNYDLKTSIEAYFVST